MDFSPYYRKIDGKYKLSRDYYIKTDIYPDGDARVENVGLSVEGGLLLLKGFVWDGPSGPAIDTPSFMRASCVHDALYKLIREGVLLEDTWRNEADDLMVTVAKADGMPWWRRWYAWAGVRLAGWLYI